MISSFTRAAAGTGVAVGGAAVAVGGMGVVGVDEMAPQLASRREASMMPARM
jgi:hypothetical protein